MYLCSKSTIYFSQTKKQIKMSKADDISSNSLFILHTIYSHRFLCSTQKVTRSELKNSKTLCHWVTTADY